MKKLILIVILIFSYSILSIGQDLKNDAFRNSISLGIGLAGYRGDVCDNFSCIQMGPSLGISYKYSLLSFFTIRTDLNYFIIKQDDFYQERNLGFRTRNFEVFLAGELGLFNDKFFSPYVFGGIGVDRFDPQAKSKKGDWVSLRPLRTENVSYAPETFILPFGIGFYLNLSSRIQLNIEGGFRKTFTDYLDDVSRFKYQPLESFNNPLAAELSMRSEKETTYSQTYLMQQRGNPRKKDHYLIFMFKLKVNF